MVSLSGGCAAESLLQQLVPGGAAGDNGTVGDGVVLDNVVDGEGSGASGESCSAAVAAVLTTDRYQLLGDQGAENKATLHVLPLGGGATV